MHGALTTTDFFYIVFEVAGITVFSVIDMDYFKPVEDGTKKKTEKKFYKKGKKNGVKLRMQTLYYMIFCTFIYVRVNYPSLVDKEYLYKAMTTRNKVRGAKKLQK